MKNKLILALVFGWYFSMQAEYDGEGAKVRTVVGPFKSDIECKAELDNAKEVTKGLEVKFSKCAYKQES